jgi:hypothetical protein
LEQLTVQGHEGRPLRCVVDEGPRGTAIVFPGAFYVPQAPLLWLAHECLAERGLGVVEVWWEFAEDLEDEEAVEWVHGQRAGPREALAAGRPRREVARDGGPGVTRAPRPLDLADADARAGEHAPRAGRRDGAGALAVIGANDPLAPRELWPELPAHAELLELEGADHGLRVGDPAGTAAVLARVVDAMRAFLEREL